MKSLLTTIFVLFCQITSVFAEGRSAVETFKPLSQRNVRLLVERGITNIGKLDLKKLLKELDEVDWRTNNVAAFLMGSGGVRTTSIYLVEKKTVYINTIALINLVNKPVYLDSWALHEGMGALGYIDENYELSSSISFLAKNTQIETPTLIKLVEANFKKITRVQENHIYAALSGGETVVGSGGDAVIADLKQRLLFRYFARAIERSYPFDLELYEFGKLTRLEIEFDLQKYDYGNTDFSFDGHKVLINLGGQIHPEVIYGNEYLDAILNTVQLHWSKQNL